MPRAPATFKQADVTRAIKAARAAGLPVAETRIDREGRIVLVHAEAQAKPDLSPLEQWKANRHARSA